MKEKFHDYRFRRNLGFVLFGFLMTWLIFTFLLFPNLSLLKITMFPDGQFDLKPVMQILRS